MIHKVFVSHASEDKIRFVNEFATKLRSKGIDAWLDKWEMLPGDSLVDKIFEEGIKNANALIVVLSTVSVSKPWVREELNAGFVSKVSKGTKIIPVLIDECEVPESLKSTLWIKIADLNNYENEFAEIASSIFNVSQKPPLGEPPAYITDNPILIDDITAADTAVLKKSCEYLISAEREIIEADAMFSNPEELGLTFNQISDSLEILDSEGCIKVSRYMGGPGRRFSCHYTVTGYGFKKFAEKFYTNYTDYINRCAGLIVNDGIMASVHLKEMLQIPRPVLDFIIEGFENNDLIKVSRYMGGRFNIYEVTARFRRMLENQ